MLSINFYSIFDFISFYLVDSPFILEYFKNIHLFQSVPKYYCWCRIKLEEHCIHRMISNYLHQNAIEIKENIWQESRKYCINRLPETEKLRATIKSVRIWQALNNKNNCNQILCFFKFDLKNFLFFSTLKGPFFNSFHFFPNSIYVG